MNSMKRALVGSLAAVMMLGSLTACGGVKKSELSDDYSKVVAATYGNENIYLDEVNFILRDRQYMYEYYSAMYGMNLLNSAETVDILYQEALSSVLQTRVLCQHAADYSVELTEDEKALVTDAVKSILENDTMNNYYEIAGRDETMLTELLTKNAIANKVYFTIKEGAEITTTMDECTKNAVTYLLLSEVAEEAEAEEVETEEVETEEEAEETVAYTEDDANKVLARVEAGESLDDIAEEMGLSTQRGNYTVNVAPETELGVAASTMTEGQSKVIYIKDTGWYVLNCTATVDQDATEDAYEASVSTEKETHFSSVYEGLSKDKFSVVDEVISMLNVMDTPVFNIEAPVEDPTELESESEATE